MFVYLRSSKPDIMLSDLLESQHLDLYQNVAFALICPRRWVQGVQAEKPNL